MSRVKVLLGGALGVLTLGAVALSNGSVSAAAGAQGSPQRLSPEILYPDNQDVLPSLRQLQRTARLRALTGSENRQTARRRRDRVRVEVCS